jgi:hypothetical protein
MTASIASGAGYMRPKSADQVRAALVPAYKQCTPAGANRTHGPALAFASCNPPVPTSDWVTVGTTDANAQDANSEGVIKFIVVHGNPQTPRNDADVKVWFNETDIRKKSDLTDYFGQLRAQVITRITDTDNSCCRIRRSVPVADC